MNFLKSYNLSQEKNDFSANLANIASHIRVKDRKFFTRYE